MGFLGALRTNKTTKASGEGCLLYNSRVARFRKSEYPVLKGITYLDHGGTTLASISLLKSFSKEMQNNLLANPHSDTSNPSASSTIVTETRLRVLQMFHADPKQFDVVFTANATASVKLVMECFSGLGGFDYYYHRNSHTSLVGVREVATRSGCFASDEDTENWISHGHGHPEMTSSNRPTLFAYPAQSNMNGQRLPLQWADQIRKSGKHPDTYTLLDVAAFVSTTPLDLSDHASAPDFTVLSFYKIFGFPDLGALIVRKASSHILERRRYFGGGTTEMTTCFGETPWTVRKQANLYNRLEDGTIAIRSILALRCAIDCHLQLFGNMERISNHTGWLAKTLYDRLSVAKHSNGVPVCHIYKAPTSNFDDLRTQGATITFNIRRSDGSWMSPYTVGAMLRGSRIHVRTGSLCNPGGMASALKLSPADMRAAFDEGFRCNDHEDVRIGGALFGMVRVTLGAMSTMKDVEIFAKFIETRLVDCTKTLSQLSGQGPGLDNRVTTPSLKEKAVVQTGMDPLDSRGLSKGIGTLMSVCFHRGRASVLA